MALTISEHAAKFRFGGNREAAIQRDGEKCMQCGLTRIEHKRKYNRDITVDHIDGNGNGKPKELKNNSLDNLRTLCLTCHSRKDNLQKRLTDNQVANIMHLKGSLTNAEIGKIYGVTKSYVSHLHRGVWRQNITRQEKA